MSFGKFFDKYGNMLPNSWDTSSENPNLFNAYARLLMDLINVDLPLELRYLKEDAVVYGKWMTNDGIVKTNEYDTSTSGNYLSLDESLGYAYMARKNKLPGSLGRLKVWTSQTWFRFYDVVPSLILFKYKVPWGISHVLKMSVSISCIVACMKPKGKTSGKMKAFLQIHAHDLRITKWICHKLLGPMGFYAASSVYFPEYHHPINEMMRYHYGVPEAE